MNETDPTVAATEPQVAGERSGGISGYQLGPLIGRGGMGEVVLAHDPDIGRDVALKRMKAATPELVERFLREARIQARLDHPAIVPVHEVGRDEDNVPFFTMKRVTGTTLEKKIETEKQQRLLRAFVDVCLAIDFAHARGVVHRDLKPSNIMLGDYGEVYVLVIVLTGRFAIGITRARLAAQRHVQIQAWHLRQLLPRPRTIPSGAVSTHI